MGIFRDFAHTYLDHGLSIIPVSRDEKRPLISGWQKFCEEKPTKEQVDHWVKTCENANIGVCMGPASGLVAFDFDYAYDSNKVKVDVDTFSKDLKFIEHSIRTDYLPETPLMKRGAKGFTAFYKWSDELVNTSCDRNGVRLFDLLCSGRQTIVPPSMHANGKDRYVWLDEDVLSVDLLTLPPLDVSVIEQVKSTFTIRGKNTLKNSRHGKVFIHAASIASVCESDDEIIQSMIEYDIKNNQPPYLSDEKYLRSNRCDNAHDMCVKWLPRIRNFVANHKKKQIDKGTKAKAFGDEYDVYSHFFNKHYVDARKCPFSNVVKYKNEDNIWMPVLNEVKTLRSLAKSESLSVTPVEDHLSRWSHYKEKKFFIDIPKWDGKERLRDIIDFFPCKNLDANAAYELFTDWCVKVLLRAKSNKVQNRCLVFKSPQGIGKDRFFELFFEPLECYYTDASIKSDEQKNYEVIDGLMVINLPEIDKYRDIAVEVFKDLITRNKATYRAVYAREAVERTFHHSFVASCNRDDLLQDTTGNRRYLVFEIDKLQEQVVSGYDHLLGPQVWSEIKHLAQMGFKASAISERQMDQYIKINTPENPEDMVVEYYDQKMELAFPYTQYREKRKTHAQVEPIISDMKKLLGFGYRTIMATLLRNGRYKRIGGQSHYFFGPKKGTHAGVSARHADTKSNVHGIKS
jgi:hypothetical protein